ncbi:MAG: hypothetical protein Q9219_004316 [cf. Caloplaca sp. 3 TL-2023]
MLLCLFRYSTTTDPSLSGLDPLHKEIIDLASRRLAPRSEIPQNLCERDLLCGGGSGEDFNDSTSDFGGSSGDFADHTGAGNTSPTEPNAIPAIEVVGHRDDAPVSAPNTASGSEIQPVAVNEDKGLSWQCALHSMVGGWEAGLACSMLEEKYGKGKEMPPGSSKPKGPAPAIPAASPAPRASVPAPKGSGIRGGGRAGMVP